MDVKEEGLVKAVNGKAEIDTRPPFRSVREAVSLFGNGVLAADMNTRKLRQLQTFPAGSGSDPESTATELEEAKHNLEKAKEETEMMATEMSSLKKELDNTRRELRQLKQLRGSPITDLQEVEYLKFVKDSPKLTDNDDDDDDEEETVEFQKKRYVTFAHPTLSQIILPGENPSPAQILERSSSVKKKKKNKSFGRLLPLIGGIFPKRKTKCDTDM